MARPINANADATRRRLVDVAMAQFAQHGFHGASTRDLAAAAGVNVATVHYYFQASCAGELSGLFVHHALLHPDGFGSDFYGGFHDLSDVLGAAEDVYDVDLLGDIF